MTLDGEALSRLEGDRYLAPGPHKVAVAVPGFIPVELEVPITAGQVQLIAPKLEKLPPARGTVEVICTPWCEIDVDGRSSGKNSPARISLPTGPHKLRLGNPTLGLSKEVEVRVEAGEVQRVAVTLSN